MACPTFQIHQGSWLLSPLDRPPDWWEGRVQLLCHSWVCGSILSQLQAGTQALINTLFGMWVFAVSLPPIKLGKPGFINAFKGLAGGI